LASRPCQGISGDVWFFAFQYSPRSARKGVCRESIPRFSEGLPSEINALSNSGSGSGSDLASPGIAQALLEALLEAMLEASPASSIVGSDGCLLHLLEAANFALFALDCCLAATRILSRSTRP
jgi:hypothetical protein